MPIYEFYCSGCNTLFNFFSPRVDTQTRPPCPRCGERPLERRPARFATLRSQRADGEEPFDSLDQEALGGLMDSVLDEVSAAGDADDPALMARMIRRFSAASGLEPGPKMDELIRRLEAGEDPDRLEEELGDSLDDDEGMAELFRLRRSSAWRGRRRPRIDDTLYFL